MNYKSAYEAIGYTIKYYIISSMYTYGWPLGDAGGALSAAGGAGTGRIHERLSPQVVDPAAPRRRCKSTGFLLPFFLKLAVFADLIHTTFIQIGKRFKLDNTILK